MVSLHSGWLTNERRPNGFKLQLSLGDARSYYLSTADRHLGVLYAVSSDGNPMEAIGCTFVQVCENKMVRKLNMSTGETMRDKITGHEESRKVAGPS